MSIATISTVLNGPDDLGTQLEGATSVARATNAHLHVLALCVLLEPAIMVHAALDGVPAGIDMAESIETLKSMVAQVQASMASQDIRWNMDGSTAAPGAFASEVARMTRFSDLVVHQRSDGGESAARTRLLAEAVLFDADTAILLLPAGKAMASPPARPLIAWDISPAALRATRQALPLLADSAHADVVMIGHAHEGGGKTDPGGEFAQFLSRHGVNCEISMCDPEGESIAAALERRALELGSDLLVMGAYGHSRLRQALFGGTTRDVLAGSSLPVLMAH